MLSDRDRRIVSIARRARRSERRWNRAADAALVLAGLSAGLCFALAHDHHRRSGRRCHRVVLRSQVTTGREVALPTVPGVDSQVVGSGSTSRQECSGS